MEHQTYKRYLWRDLESDVASIFEQIKKTENCYNAVVGLSRGGLTPAVMLSHRLDIPMISFEYSFRDNCMIGDFVHLSQYKNILVVDDICDSGKTLTSLQDVLFSLYPMIFADYTTLIYNTEQKFVPNFYGRIIERSKTPDWFIFPWENK